MKSFLLRDVSVFVDCTFRDGGYYNAWDFSPELIHKYLEAMQAARVDVVELGFRTLKNQGFQGACAFTTDEFIRSLTIPAGLTVGVMVNGNELVGEVPQQEALERLFPNAAADSPVDLVRIACHVHEFEKALPAVTWLKERGYQVGFNLMQVADRTEEEVKALARLAKAYPMDALYFADSMGSMSPDQAAQIIQWFRSEWKGPMGIHTHDNLGLALSNTLRALDEGVTWVDSTVTGMGRGPGNARTEGAGHRDRRAAWQIGQYGAADGAAAQALQAHAGPLRLGHQPLLLPGGQVRYSPHLYPGDAQ
ncbi:aldolase catalytic domain-containing protein [Thiorhodospira sibirica]|uniref:aldolase catalytic domain-containing protein n=1 Tax=Thiorhodospira sibirica TaxID=154347 RepID=UPI00022C2E08|nr:aldolase catalytic domain-containing protein [Thiorhodospira sibirica]